LHLRKIRVGAPGDRIAPSGGYRLILQVLDVEGKTVARCLELYYKPDQADLPSAEGFKLIMDSSDEENPA
jgi:hypothetical protein